MPGLRSLPSENVSRLTPPYSWFRRSHSVHWSKNVFASPRVSQPGCMIPMSIAVCRPTAVWLLLCLDTSPCCDVVMLFCASDLTVVTRRQYSCFALSFISQVSSANGFSANPENAPSTTCSRFDAAATDSKMKDHSLYLMSCPEKGHIQSARQFTTIAPVPCCRIQ